ncbi:MAG: hypothetical protein DMD59_08800 [Gemmatimonadetes bacterium]|nr:MAG: hypothetical protein DMD59_08800 [Gemmatimonadota bacterium]
MLSGFTLVRNAVQLNFPIVAAIASVLEVCDEVVVNVGRSDDETRPLVAGVRDSRVRIVDSEWDLSKGDDMLALETQRAMDACRGSWGIYIQADEVLHERGAHILRQKVAEWDRDEQVEGMLVDYLHFYGGFDRVATNRQWYRREVRCLRLGRGIRPYQGAQGFRVGPEFRKIRARLTGAQMFHYGWARPAQTMREKIQLTKQMYPWATERLDRDLKRGTLKWIPLLRRFTGSHPAAARDWIAANAKEPPPALEPARFKPAHVRLYMSDWIERLSGVRPFEFRNYEVV